MKRLATDLLQTTEALEHDVYHESGLRLFQKSEPLAGEHLSFLSRAGVNQVFLREAEDNIVEFMRHARYVRVPLEQLRRSQVLALPVYDEAGRLLVDAGAPATMDLRRYLQKAGIESVSVHREDDLERPARRFLDLKREHTVERRRREVTTIHLRAAKMLLAPRVAPEELAAGAAAAREEALPAGAPLSRLVDADFELRSFSDEEKARCVRVFHEAVTRMAALYDRVRGATEIDASHLVETVRDVLLMLVADKDLLLNLLNDQPPEDYLASHAVKTAVAAVNIATASGYGDEQVLEMGFGSLLNDVGMVRVAPEIRGKAGELTPDERREMQAHPAHGLALLRLVSGVPKSSLYVVYQSHERFNGAGYPRGIRGEDIHPFARIVAAADAYVAQASRRPYRDPKLPYHSMEAVIRAASERLFDGRVVRSMLEYLSLFPVGSWVELSNDTIARVVAANKSNYARPVVQMLFEAGSARPLARPALVNLAANPALFVQRPVNGAQWSALDRWHGFS
ncbi:MAG: hypothetical protein HY719_00230 [Planctomycetes bacterium]|nr:hypothetical protein [Planctomycetota bacterium]